MPRLLYSRSECTGNLCLFWWRILYCWNTTGTASPVTAGNAQQCQSWWWWCGVISSTSWKRKNSIREEWNSDERRVRARARSPSVFSSGNNSSLSLTRIAPDASAPTSFLSYSLGRLVWERSNQFQIMEPDETRFKNMAFPVFRGPTTLELLLFETLTLIHIPTYIHNVYAD